MKIVDLLRSAAADDGGDKVVFSFEYMLPRTDDKEDELLERMKRMVAHNPTFCDITWRAGKLDDEERTVRIAKKMQTEVCVETMVHLTCRGTPAKKIDEALSAIKSAGVQNVLALHGDPPKNPAQVPRENPAQIQGNFSCALDLVQHMRAEHDDYFGIAVAGYPEAHSTVTRIDGVATPEGYENDLNYLKQKVDAGADFIITQVFYDTDIFLKFVDDCRQIGITCPIVPGIMPLTSQKKFDLCTEIFQIKMPVEVKAKFNSNEDNNSEDRRAYGVQLATDMCKKLMASGIKTLHLYTMNEEESALRILMDRV